MWLDIQVFGFRALWSPYFFLFVVAIGVIYYLVTIHFRHKFGDGNNEKPSVRQLIAFYSALVLLYLVKGGPIDLLSHIMLTSHMIQMAIFYIIFPMLIIIGIPKWVWDRFVNQPIIKPIVKFLTFPLISLFLFNTLFSLYHLPVVFNFAKSSQLAHTSTSLVILFAAFIVWFPILSPLKEYDTLKPLQKIFYIFANSVLITPACVLIIFADTPLYATYTANGAWMQALSLCVPGDVLNDISYAISGPEMFSPMSILEDQQFGGIIMKVMQEIAYGIILGKVFYAWFSKESLKVDPLPSTNVTETTN